MAKFIELTRVNHHGEHVPTCLNADTIMEVYKPSTRSGVGCIIVRTIQPENRVSVAETYSTVCRLLEKACA